MCPSITDQQRLLSNQMMRTSGLTKRMGFKMGLGEIISAASFSCLRYWYRGAVRSWKYSNRYPRAFRSLTLTFPINFPNSSRTGTAINFFCTKSFNLQIYVERNRQVHSPLP